MAKDFNTILSEAQQIKNEIIEGANTALRTGTCLEDIVQRAEFQFKHCTIISCSEKER